MQRVTRTDLDNMVVACERVLPFKVRLDHDATGYRLQAEVMAEQRTMVRDISPRLTPKDMLLWLRAYHMGLLQGRANKIDSGLVNS